MKTEYQAWQALQRTDTVRIGATFHKPAPVRQRIGMLARFFRFWTTF